MDQSRLSFSRRHSALVYFRPLLAVISVALPARAAEPRLVSEPYLFAEPAEITQVVDAFDDGDAFDLNLSIGYQYSQQSSTLQRESESEGKAKDFGKYTETTHRLMTRADIGLYRDIALVLRMPIILSNDRGIDATGSTADQKNGTRSAASDNSVPLFGLPFSSPTRSGIEYLAVGLDFGILNQYRDPAYPTWVFGVEGRFSISSPMHACNSKPADGQVDCADPGDVNRNGTFDPSSPIDLESNPVRKFSKGVSRGTTGLEVHTYLSKRIKYIEPYGGLKFLAEFPNQGSAFGQVDFKSSLVNTPPLEGTILTGIAIIPWEVKNTYQRATFDLRYSSTYRSEGRDYSEMFDALGSSAARSMRTPNWSNYVAAQGNSDVSVADTNSKKAYFNGLTHVEQHLKNRLSAEFTWQAAKYMKLGIGVGYTFIQSHFLTNDQACNANNTGNASRSGPCRKDLITANGTASDTDYQVTGIPNPNYRATLNSVGSRFRVDDSSLVDTWLYATILF
jgi:hypothetical protein